MGDRDAQFEQLGLPPAAIPVQEGIASCGHSNSRGFAGIDLSTDEMKEPPIDIRINQWYSLYPSRGLRRPRGPKKARTEAEDSESKAKGSELEAGDVDGAVESSEGYPVRAGKYAYGTKRGD
ncbi:hypothetical protein LWI28_007799 [Acer negundo]|uniref:Uncharacterized protein n=1 Tax=Acer negundo TaxID=4023 RepID=A0AAD5J4R7_ACENE|nr:hypothetical protein LWI28_007799 [Acer negundo]